MQNGSRCLKSWFGFSFKSSPKNCKSYGSILQKAPFSTSIPHSSQFAPLRPPDPSTLPKPKSVKSKLKFRKRWSRLFWISATGLAIYTYDRQFQASSLTRSLKTFYTGLYVGFDYKINFRPNPPFADSIEDVHARSARRVFNLINTNGGLYLKLGQAIAMQSAVLPPAFREMFEKLFDDASQNEWSDVHKTLKEAFGAEPEEIFDVIEHTARASASVAQVHWARLKNGDEVAVKIQKREIAKQISWDLWSFKVVSTAYAWWFELPVQTLVPYISERLMLETDFQNEAENSKNLERFIQNESRLRDRVYIPKVYDEYTTKKILTAEWIEGVRLWDLDTITNPWRGGSRGTPGAGGQSLEQLPLQDDKGDGHIKPDRSSWRGYKNKGGLGLSLKQVMTTMVDLFSAQMFIFGVVHCDPHPGNLFVRRLPNGKSELVLIDHGLYINMTPEFRKTWAEFWKALISLDNSKIIDILTGWGINHVEMFASATLMRPYTGVEDSFMNQLKDKSDKEKHYLIQKRMTESIKDMLKDEANWPRELIFLWRNLRIVQGNNQFMGSPVNRIKITGLWASKALVEAPNLPFNEKVGNFFKHMVFRLTLLASDMIWWTSRIRQLVGKGKGMDDDIEEEMKKMAKSVGVDMNRPMFDG